MLLDNKASCLLTFGGHRMSRDMGQNGTPPRFFSKFLFRFFFDYIIYFSIKGAIMELNVCVKLGTSKISVPELRGRTAPKGSETKAFHVCLVDQE